MVISLLPGPAPFREPWAEEGGNSKRRRIKDPRLELWEHLRSGPEGAVYPLCLARSTASLDSDPGFVPRIFVVVVVNLLDYVGSLVPSRPNIL